MSCSKCNCSPCQCTSTVLNNPQIIGGVFDGPTVNGPTVNGGTLNQPNVVGALIDCTTRGCTQPAGICDASLATTSFVCTAVIDAISGSNPAFCVAVNDCLAADPTALCAAIGVCINSTPGIINNTSAFGFNSRATTGLYGVVRYATSLELQNGNCLLAIDPCTLIANWNAPPVGSPFWNAFTNAVNAVITATGICAAVDACLATSATLCAAVFACGAAPLASPIFTGDPRAPTPAPGDNDTSVATTAFVQGAVNTAVNSSNPSFCAAVSGCVAAPPTTGNFASFSVPCVHDGVNAVAAGPGVANYGCSISGVGLAYNVAFNAPQPDMNFTANTSLRGVAGVGFQMFIGEGGQDLSPSTNTIRLFANSVASIVNTSGISDLFVVPPTVGGGLPYSGVITVVFSR